MKVRFYMFFFPEILVKGAFENGTLNCGFSLAEEGVKRKKFFFQTAGSMGSSLRGVHRLFGFAWLPVVCEKLMLYLSPFIFEALPVRFTFSKLF